MQLPRGWRCHWSQSPALDLEKGRSAPKKQKTEHPFFVRKNVDSVELLNKTWPNAQGSSFVKHMPHCRAAAERKVMSYPLCRNEAAIGRRMVHLEYIFNFVAVNETSCMSLWWQQLWALLRPWHELQDVPSEIKTQNKGRTPKDINKEQQQQQQQRRRFAVGRQSRDNRIKRHEGHVREKGSKPEETERSAWASIPWKYLCPRWLYWGPSQHAQQWWIGPVRRSQTNRDLYSVWQLCSRRRTEQWHFPTCWVTMPSEIWQDTYAGGAQLFLLYEYALSRHIIDLGAAWENATQQNTRFALTVDMTQTAAWGQKQCKQRRKQPSFFSESIIS